MYTQYLLICFSAFEARILILYKKYHSALYIIPDKNVETNLELLTLNTILVLNKLVILN